MSGERSADRAAEPPRRGHPRCADHRQCCHDRNRVDVAEERARRQEPVVGHAVMGRTRRAHRPEKGHLFVANPVEHREQLGALIVVPLAAARQTHKSEHRRQDEDRR